MRRRELVLILGGALTQARPLRAQPKAMPVVGYLHIGPPQPSASNAPVSAFYQGLNDTGYFVGQNVAIDYRWADGHYDRLPALATDLVGRKVDVIVAIGGNAIAAAKGATSTIPIVFLGGGGVTAARQEAG